MLKEIEEIDYLSGWQALNIPTEDGRIADWHSSLYFPLKKVDDMFLFDKEKIKRYSTNGNPLGRKGIKKIYISRLKDVEYVANYPRSIADLFLTKKLGNINGIIRDSLTECEKNELYDYLMELEKIGYEVDAFLKKEMPLIHIRRKRNDDNIGRISKKTRTDYQKYFEDMWR